MPIHSTRLPHSIAGLTEDSGGELMAYQLEKQRALAVRVVAAMEHEVLTFDSLMRWALTVSFFCS